MSSEVDELTLEYPLFNSLCSEMAYVHDDNVYVICVTVEDSEYARHARSHGSAGRSSSTRLAEGASYAASRPAVCLRR